MTVLLNQPFTIYRHFEIASSGPPLKKNLQQLRYEVFDCVTDAELSPSTYST